LLVHYQKDKPVRESQPLLQRLLGDGWNNFHLNDVVSAIKKDVEGLLNAFSAPIRLPKSCKQLSDSVLNFGLPNYLGPTYHKTSQRLKLCEEIRERIEQKEPRLKDIRVAMNGEDNSLDMVFQIRIDAKIYWKAQLKSVVLQSNWNPLTMSFNLL
jgi:type VI secretion system protein ImpF